MKTRDTLPVIQAQLSVNGAIADLTGATVRLNGRVRGDSTNRIIEGICAIVGDPTLGNVQYNWNPQDTVRAGTLEYEFRITFSDGTTATCPSEGYLSWPINQGLG